MIKKMQLKFVLLSMSAFLLVLTVIITCINIVNYNTVKHDADELLRILSDDQGAFHEGPSGMGNRLPPGMSPETPYETRYFSVVLDWTSYKVLQVETGKIFSVDTSEAIDYALTVVEKSEDSGFVDNFRFSKKLQDSRVVITFLDCGRSLDAFNKFLITSIAISLVGYVLVFILISFFANRIIRPISESYEKQKQFITDAGHELKTPLTIISADADILKMEIGESEWVEDIKLQTKRLTDLTNNLIFLSRMEEGGGNVQMITFPISDIISETIQSFQALAYTRNIDFQSAIQPMLSFCGNERAIRELVSVLLDNAIKYCSDGGVVSAKLIPHGKNLIFSVTNTISDEIDSESLTHLFDRFYRLDSSRNSQNGGFGIGLSVAKAIVSSHNGKISAESDNGIIEISVQLPNQIS